MALMHRQLNIPTLVTEDLASYLTTIPLGAWWRFRDTSGTNVVNSGSIGSAIDLTATAWTMAQTGQLGAGEAGLTDGATTLLTCANNATLKAYTTYEWGFLIKPSGPGEGNAARLLCWGAGSNEPSIFFNASLAITARFYNTTNDLFATITSTGLSTTAYTLLFVAFNGSVISIRKGIGGAVSEFGYTSQTSLTGTYKQPTSAFNLFNRTGQDFTFAGLGDEAFCIGTRMFTDAERLKMTQLAGC